MSVEAVIASMILKIKSNHPTNSISIFSLWFMLFRISFHAHVKSETEWRMRDEGWGWESITYSRKLEDKNKLLAFELVEWVDFSFDFQWHSTLSIQHSTFAIPIQYSFMSYALWKKIPRLTKAIILRLMNEIYSIGSFPYTYVKKLKKIGRQTWK